MVELTNHLFASGETVPEPLVRTLRAGFVAVDYAGGFLRYLRVGGHEIVRMINFAVRDQDWNTIPFRILDERLEEHADSFKVRFCAEFNSGAIRYDADVCYEGGPDGSVVCSFDGHALSFFHRNRIGFMVLHPLEGCVGERISILHTNGCEELGRFPQLISGDQPFRDVAGMTWQIGDCTARLRFEGDVFETEDQRNWTDASFKTYCTPLELPFPVKVAAGDCMRQRVAFEIISGPRSSPTNCAANHDVQLSIAGSSRALPKIGVARSREVNALAIAEVDALRALQLSHYRCEADMTSDDCSERLAAAAREAVQLRSPLELVLFLRDGSGVGLLEKVLASSPVEVARVTVLGRDSKTTPSGLLAGVMGQLRCTFPRARIGAGTDAFFAELNRQRLSPAGLDFLTYSINPQVHAFDRHSLIETLEAQAHTVASARAFADGAEVQVSPVTFRMRWNPNATSLRDSDGDVDEFADVDARQLSLFGAGWTLGSVAQLAAAGAGAITFFETVGMRGLMQSQRRLASDRFPAPAGVCFPMYFLFLELAGAKTFRTVHANAERRVSALLVEGDQGTRLLIANLTPESMRVHLPETFSPVRRRMLDATAWARVASEPQAHLANGERWSGRILELPPFVFVAMDGLLNDAKETPPAAPNEQPEGTRS